MNQELQQQQQEKAAGGGVEAGGHLSPAFLATLDLDECDPWQHRNFCL
jgi:hypothetical protein